MRTIFPFVSFLAVILNSIDSGSQSDSSPEGDAVLSASHCGSSNFPEKNDDPVKILDHARPQSPPSPVRSDPIAEPSLRARSRSPPARYLPTLLLEYGLERLKLIRLIPKASPDKLFEIRKYTFPRDKPIKVRGKSNFYEPMPREEESVLSTSSGDIFGIFERNNTVIRGIYTTTRLHSGNVVEKRVKFNMNSGAIEYMTPQEIKEAPLGTKRLVSKNFKTIVVAESRPEDNPHL